PARLDTVYGSTGRRSRDVLATDDGGQSVRGVPSGHVWPSDPSAGGQLRRRRTESFAAGRMRGKELAGIHDPRGIEVAAEPGHEGQIGVAELERHAPGLVEPDAVLPGDAAAHREAGAQELVVGMMRAVQLARHPVVVEDHRMEISVAGMEDVGDDETMAGADRQ